MSIANLLSIAGSDSSGGAGIQADLKTFSALNTYGLTVITALTAQNTQGVQAVHPVAPEFVKAQLDSVFSDIHIDAVKIGMLANADIIHVVAHALRQYQPRYIVLDPVMFSKNHHPLLDENAIAVLRQTLLPLAHLITPNLPEAAALSHQQLARNEDEMQAQGQALCQLGAHAVLMKGGHLNATSSPDWLITPHTAQRFSHSRIQTRHTHGTGCTLSAAIAAHLPHTATLESAVEKAKSYLSHALQANTQLSVGQGIGPVHHFYAQWPTQRPLSDAQFSKKIHDEE